MIHSAPILTSSKTFIQTRVRSLIRSSLMNVCLERAGSVTESYNDFINSAQQYGTSMEWILAQEGAGTFRENRYELKRKLFRAIANVNVLEGIRFYVSSRARSHLANFKLMEGSAKIISLIARDENQHLVIDSEHSEQVGRG